MRWQLRLRAAERGVFKAVEMRRLLAQAGLPVSTGKMSARWSTTVTPGPIRRDDLDIICRVLGRDAAPAPDPATPAGRRHRRRDVAVERQPAVPRPAGGRTRPSMPPV
ncbi:XRE family transcriptional regulator [Streptomyces sp. NPDC004528]|uniref:XRE family transcriptional regulator n=1 Tax=Streptomyces sp. NPDC004528 TaxID=3154550 RepID=UPI0033A0A1BD